MARIGAADYLAVGAAAHRDALAPLLAHRRAQGHEAAFLAIEELAATGPAWSERLRELVVAAHASAGNLRYLLLVGDVDGEAAIPTFDEHDPVLGEAFASDHPYAAVAGRPLAIGRVPVRNALQAAAFVAKVIRYETSEAPGPWQRRLSLFAGAAEFGPVVDRLIENHARRLLDERLSYDWDVNVLFSREGSPYAPRFDRLEDVIADELEAGALMAVYVGHGYAQGFAGASYRDHYFPSFGSWGASQLAIEEGRPLFLSLSCLTGDFTAGYPSLAETLLLNDHGPVAVVAASGRSHPYANALIAESLLEAFFEERAPTVGEGLVDGAEAMMTAELPVAQFFVSAAEAQAIKRSNRRMYHLLGDPATRPRYPERLEVALEGPARPGRSLGVRVAKVPDGAALEVTLETRRSVVKPPEVAVDVEALDVWEAQEVLARNRARALDKVVARVSTTAPGAVDIRIPPTITPGRYYVKVLARGATTATGHAVVDIP